jgi:hypothetical protein
MLPRWFRIVLALDAVLVIGVAVLGARLVLDGARAVAPLIRWEHPQGPSGPAPGPVAAPSPSPAAAAPGGRPAETRLDASLLHHLDTDAASTATAQQGLLGTLEEMIRRQVVAILEHGEQTARGG